MRRVATDKRVTFDLMMTVLVYTQPLPQTSDAAAGVYITFPTRRLTQHTRLWDDLRGVAKLTTYAPQYDYNRHVEMLIQLRNDGTNAGRWQNVHLCKRWTNNQRKTDEGGGFL